GIRGIGPDPPRTEPRLWPPSRGAEGPPGDGPRRAPGSGAGAAARVVPIDPGSNRIPDPPRRRAVVPPRHPATGAPGSGRRAGSDGSRRSEGLVRRRPRTPM
ncbi:MAG: hypothetical protein AVDCRST_MAG59-5369, partial [uncultured Thermomicrobiales bacterium]